LWGWSRCSDEKLEITVVNPAEDLKPEGQKAARVIT
jgi:hypothetical protein